MTLGAAALIARLSFVPRTALLWCGHPDIMRILPLPCKGLFPSGRAVGWHAGSPKKHFLGSKSFQTNLPLAAIHIPAPGRREGEPTLGGACCPGGKGAEEGPQSINWFQLLLCRGFCFFNSVAIAARQLQQKGKLSKILIVDWVSPLGHPACPRSYPVRP